ncbi:esterase/lipase family protein [Solicola sp. PLA-1-18]|uniref:esterase/lipase family protein n=1 Tax=Solicola sp. PLA-1-18 TaxID=3380532 RepID=UPI003B7FBA8D
MTSLLAAVGLTSGARPLDAAGVAVSDAPPSSQLRWGEVRAAVQVARVLAAAPRLALAPRGDGGVVVDVPGWRAPEASGAPIRAYLRSLGHDARPWGLGTNHGSVGGDVDALAVTVARLARESGRPVALVGWSLGGVIAREVARLRPADVRAVVTYGSPVLGGPTIAPHLAGRHDAVRTPVTAIVSRRDGVVDWRACVDRRSSAVEHVEVGSTHLGMVLDPDVWAVVADRLGRVVPRTVAKP